MYDVTFNYVDEESNVITVTLTSNYKTYQKNIDKCKKYCKERKGIFLKINSIK